MTPIVKSTSWSPHRVRRIDGDRYVDLPARCQVPTRDWNRVVGMPYLVYMPEKDRVLMLVYLDYHPCKAAVMFSDDHGATWSEPALVPQAEDERCLGMNLMYLGGGTVMFCDERNRWFSHDYGLSWPEKMPVQPDVTGASLGGLAVGAGTGGPRRRDRPGGPSRGDGVQP